jgi:hypothetical protein
MAPHDVQDDVRQGLDAGRTRLAIEHGDFAEHVAWVNIVNAHLSSPSAIQDDLGSAVAQKENIRRKQTLLHQGPAF